MSNTANNYEEKYDIFVSYAHADNEGEYKDWVTALKDAILQENAEFNPHASQMKIFFDIEDINTMDDWDEKILTGLRQSKIMIAVLSPNYFNSTYCKKEWQHYCELEKQLGLLGSGIAGIYVVEHPEFSNADENHRNQWLRDLKKRQYEELHPWWHEGRNAFERTEVRQRLQRLEMQIIDRVKRADRAENSSCNVPVNVNFTGRNEEMRQLHRKLTVENRHGFVAVHGAAGIGKTAMCYQYARSSADYFHGGQFYVTCAFESDLRNPILSLAPELGVDINARDLKNIDFAYSKLKSQLVNCEPIVIILDNVDNEVTLREALKKAYLQIANNVYVIVTTRQSTENIQNLPSLPLRHLSKEESLYLLERYRHITEEDQSSAAEIVQFLGGHSLTLEVVAVYLWKTPSVSYQKYADILKKKGINLLENTGKEVKYNSGLSLHEQTMIKSLFAPTLALLNDEEKKIIALASVMAPESIVVAWISELLTSEQKTKYKFGVVLKRMLGFIFGKPKDKSESENKFDKFEFSKNLRRLVSLHLFEPGEQKNVYHMHRLIQLCINSTVSKKHSFDIINRQEKILKVVHSRAVRIYEKIEKAPTEIGKLRWEVDAIYHTINEAAHKYKLSVQWLDKLSFCFAMVGTAYREVYGNSMVIERCYKQAIWFKRKCSKKDVINFREDLEPIGELYIRLGDVLRAQANYKKTIYYYKLAHDKCANFLKKDNDKRAVKMCARATNKLSTVYRRNGELKTSETYCMKALDYYKEISDEHGCASCYVILATLTKFTGRYKLAMKYYNLALVIRKKRYENYSANSLVCEELAYLLCQIGRIYLEQGKFKKAESKYMEGYLLRKACIDAGVNDSLIAKKELAFSLDYLGYLDMRTNRITDAFNRFQESLNIRSKLAQIDNNSADILLYLSISYTNLGSVYEVMSEMMQAEKSYAEAIKIRQDLFHKNIGYNHYAQLLAKTYFRMGYLYLRMGKLLESYKFLLLAIILQIKLLFSEILYMTTTDDFILSLIAMGDLFAILGSTKEAYIIYHLSLALSNKTNEIYRKDNLKMIHKRLMRLHGLQQQSANENIYVKVWDLLKKCRKDINIVQRAADFIAEYPLRMPDENE